MPKHSSIFTLLPVVLLLFRAFLPIASVEGQQFSAPEWSNSANQEDISYPESPLENGSIAIPSNSKEDRNNWSTSSSDSGNASPNKDLNEAISPYRNGGRIQYPSKYNFDNYYYYTNRLQQLPQRPRRFQKGVARPLDFASVDDSALALPSFYSSYYSPAVSSSGVRDTIHSSASLRSNTRQPSYSRYLIYPNIKRSRDGYICHFKLCQVGVSGKRLSM